MLKRIWGDTLLPYLVQSRDHSSSELNHDLHEKPLGDHHTENIWNLEVASQTVSENLNAEANVCCKETSLFNHPFFNYFLLDFIPCR